MNAFLSRHRHTAIAVLLAILTLAVFLPVTRHEFLNYDDGLYVAGNPHVLGGLHAQSLAWAFTTFRAVNWHPVTWISLMLDASVFGQKPFGFHLMNLILHIANVLLLFLLLNRLTGSLWRSTLVAALFAIHPLHVESVAWVAERKDVLSTLFWMLTMLAYVNYARKPSAGRYAAVLVLYALGLMAKPMLVSLPLVLLMLDYWPLGRFAAKKKDSNRRLLYEKLPLFLLAAGSCIITFIAQRSYGAVASLHHIPAGLRVANALVSYVVYIGKTILPVKLSAFYPHPHSVPVWETALSAIVLALVTVLVVRAAGRRPYLAVGWLWYVVTLIPVIGLVQVGAQAMADRYTYVPLIGLFIMVAWSVKANGRKGERENWRHGAPRSPSLPLAHSPILTVAAFALIAVLSSLARIQTGYWQDSETLFRHALSVTKGNYLAHDNLGVALYNQGRLGEAADHFSKAVALDPDYADTQANLGTVLMQMGRTDEAARHLKIALRLDNNLADAHNSFGILLVEQGKPADAIKHYREALRIDPDNADTYFNIACAFAELGKLDDAVKNYSEALRLRPDDAGAHTNLGIVLMRMGQVRKAIGELEEAARLDPGNADAKHNLRNALAALTRSRGGSSIR